MENQLSLIEIINAHLESDKVKLPVFNSTALQIQKEISNEDPDLRLIEKLIVGDQSLTSSVLKVSNSSFFKGLSEVSTIHQAIVRLGINEVSSIVTLVTQEGNFNSKDPSGQAKMRKLWQHSVGCALGATWIAKQCGMSGISHEVFVAALLHDVGKLLILKVVDELKSLNEITKVSDEILNEAMVELHVNLGHSLMNKWNLPGKYAEVALHHHDGEFDTNNLLLVITRISNVACNKIGLGFTQSNGVNLLAMPETEILNLSEIDLAKLEVKLEDSQIAK